MFLTVLSIQIHIFKQRQWLWKWWLCHKQWVANHLKITINTCVFYLKNQIYKNISHKTINRMLLLIQRAPALVQMFSQTVDIVNSTDNILNYRQRIENEFNILSICNGFHNEYRINYQIVRSNVLNSNPSFR
jgi:hypothetical protein